MQLDSPSGTDDSDTESVLGHDGKHNTYPNQDERVRTRQRWTRVVAYGLLPGLAFALASGAGYLKWLDSSARGARASAVESVRVASDSAIAMLSYRPDSVEKDLTGARERLTGALKDSYTALAHDVVVPGAKHDRISAQATVAAAASVSASPTHAIVLLFVNQTVTVGGSPPTNTASRVRVTLDKINDHWLVAAFDPI